MKIFQPGARYEYHEIIEEEQPAPSRQGIHGWMNKTSCYFLHLSAKRMWPEVVVGAEVCRFRKIELVNLGDSRAGPLLFTAHYPQMHPGR
jgi:hypothetical protein